MNQKATSFDTHNTKMDRRYEGALSYAKQANPTAAGLVGANDLTMQQNIWMHQSLPAVSTNIEDKLAPPQQQCAANGKVAAKSLFKKPWSANGHQSMNLIQLRDRKNGRGVGEHGI